MLSIAETTVSNYTLETKVWNLTDLQNVNNVSDQSSQPTGKRRNFFKKFPRSVRGGYYTTLSYDVIHGVFVLFTPA